MAAPRTHATAGERVGRWWGMLEKGERAHVGGTETMEGAVTVA